MATSGQLRERSSRGQATVEFALTLPMVLLVVLMAVQILLIGHAQLRVDAAARLAARTAAIEGTIPLGQVIADRSGLDPDQLSVNDGESNDTNPDASAHVTVEVRYRYETEVPFIGALTPDLDMHASATFRSEGEP